MVAWRNVLLIVAAAALATAGLALGAASQEERFLVPKDAESFQDPGAAAGNLVVATAFLVALGGTMAVVTMSRLRWTRRVAPSITLFLGLYLVTLLVQSAWPNYNAEDITRSAAFSVSPLLTNESALASTMLGPFALLAGAILLAGAAAGRLMGRGKAKTPEQFLGRAVGLAMFATPFLAVAAAGNIRLILHLPGQDPATIPYMIVMPLLSLACLGLIVTMSMQALRLGQWMGNSRLAHSTEEAWRSLRIAELVLVSVVAGLALLGTALVAADHALLQAGRTFGVTARGHTQFHVLLLVPLAAWVALDRAVLQALRDDETRDESLVVHAHPQALALTISSGISVIVALIGVFVLDGPMWVWVLASAPVALSAVIVLSPRQALGSVFVLAIALWGTGNTITGSFLLTAEGGDAINFAVPPGASALLRFLALTWLAVGVGRLAFQDGEHLRSRLRGVVATSIAIGVALLLALELPFTAWTETVEQGEFVGIGSVVAAQTRAVQIVTHVLAVAAALAIMLPVARIHRPDWFPRRPATPMPVPDARPVT